MPLIVFVWLFEVQLKPFVFLLLELSHLFVSVLGASVAYFSSCSLGEASIMDTSCTIACYGSQPFYNDPDIRLVV